MKIRFIGTGSGKSSLERFHTSFILENGIKLLIDAGDGISRALLSSKVSFLSINSIVITHFHPDHVSGLPMLLNQMKMQDRKNPLSIYVFEKQAGDLQELCELNLIFFNKLGFHVILKPFQDNVSFTISESMNILPRANHHLDRFASDYIKTFSLFFETCNLHYTSDVDNIEDLNLFGDKSVEYLISESTHVSPVEISKRIDVNNIKKIFLVHIDSENEMHAWYNGLSQAERERIVITYDGFEFGFVET